MIDLNREFRCSHCKSTDSLPLYVEWSIPDPAVEDEGRSAEMHRNGCVAEMFCSWDCAAHWFQSESERRAVPADPV